MWSMVTIIFALLFVFQNSSMKINLQGSISLGKDILTVLEDYALRSQLFPNSQNSLANGRRSGGGVRHHPHRSNNGPQPEEAVAEMVLAQNFCHNLPLCESHDRSEFVNKYIIVLINAVEEILENVNKLASKFPVLRKSLPIVITEYRQGVPPQLTQIQDMITRANKKITEENRFYTWITLLKRISALLQLMGVKFIESQFKTVSDDYQSLNDQLTQKVVTTTVSVEEKYIMSLCNEFHICSNKFFCTETLKAVLEQLGTLGDERLSDFVREFSAALLDTNFYSILNHSIASDFRLVLENISNPHNVALKDVFATISKAVENRLKFIDRDRSKVKTQDVYLFHSILSDMDHFYSKHSKMPFTKFFEDFTTWAKYDGRLKSKLHRLFTDIAEQLASEHEDVVNKLIQEVKSFLQVTIDIETEP